LSKGGKKEAIKGGKDRGRGRSVAEEQKGPGKAGRNEALMARNIGTDI